MHARFDRLERDMRMIAETVATTRPISPRGHAAASSIAAARGGTPRRRALQVLAEQVRRRVRLGQPLMQETIDRLNSTDGARLEPAIGDDMLHNPKPGHSNQKSYTQSVDVQNASSAAAGKGGSNLYFQRLRI